VKRNLVLLF